MEYEIVKRSPITLIGLEWRLDNSDPSKFSKLWDTFHSEISANIPQKKDDTPFGLYSQYESDHTGFFSLLVGCAVQPGTQPPEGMTLREVPEKTFAKFILDGPMPGALIATWQWIWEGHLSRSFDYDLEVYGETPTLFIGLKD